MDTLKQALSAVLPSAETREPATKQHMEAIPSEESKHGVKTSLEEKQPVILEERPQTISERVKPVSSATSNLVSVMEEKATQPSYFDKIAAELEYFATEMKEKQNNRVYARAILKGRGNICGDFKFGQDLTDGSTCLVGSMCGLREGEHAINIHEFGDLSRGHASIGAHLNPFHALKHGGPLDKERHLGDLGNLKADHTGHADLDLRDLDLPLVGPFSIIGRAIEVHAAGDLGRIPACDCGQGCSCRGESGAVCPRSHECTACSTMLQMGEPLAIGLIVHAPSLESQQSIDLLAFTNPWLTLQGTTD